MHDVLTDLLKQTPVILDGAWGTQLQARGLPPGECTDGWNLSHPGEVESVAREYVEAGSQIILTNTFGASRLMLNGHGLGDKAAEINRRGAEISKRAAGGRAKVFASMGPSGKLIMMGQTTEDELLEVFREQAAALAEGGADGLVIETMSDPQEAAIAVRAAKETGLPVAGCMVFDTGKNKDRTMMGTTPEQAAEALAEAGADIIGSNCGQGVSGFVAICQRLKAACGKPIWIKANAGIPEVVDGQVVYHTTPGEFASYAPQLKEAGASFLGGCCGTTPEFIRVLKQTVDSL
ncbi:MAG: homocysteine S-methyltransferase family protein [Candidatus Omnitrophica bacterium]|nr:homocysteine S-methyltransferase family protein [Candidatus Omnitrophota bacterium]